MVYAITNKPRTILYQTKGHNVPFCKYRNKNRITIIPTRQEIKLPAIKTEKFIDSLFCWVSKNLNKLAPITAGVDNKKENRAALTRSKPNIRAAPIVIPDLETPGMKLIAWKIPIQSALLR